MTRREFPRSVRVAVIKRATRDSVVYCETCGLPAKKFQIDHIRPDGLLGEPILANAKLICDVCYGLKNPDDASKIARAKRREAGHLSASRPPDRPMQSRGFPVKPKREAKPGLPPRQIYRTVRGAT